MTIFAVCLCDCAMPVNCAHVKACALCVQFVSVRRIWHLYIHAPRVRTCMCVHVHAFVSLACIGVHLCVHACVLFVCGMFVHS